MAVVMGQEIFAAASPVRVWQCVLEWARLAGRPVEEAAPYVRLRIAGSEFRLRATPRGTRLESDDRTADLAAIRRAAEGEGAFPAEGMIGSEGGATT